MKKVLCEKNHYYDADRYDACPHCARARAFLEKTAQQPQGGRAAAGGGHGSGSILEHGAAARQARRAARKRAAYEAPAGEAASGAPDMRTMAMLEPELTAGPFFPAEPAAETLPAEPEQAALHEDVPPVRTNTPAPPDDGRTHVALHRRAKRR